VYLAWGKFAENLVDSSVMIYGGPTQAKRVVMYACHPQAENYPGNNKFVGCGHFEKTNFFLQSFGISPIKWV
jgi:uracil DNA glycosylase